MLNIMSRKLRVRDDGTGKARETTGTLSEFATEEAIVLLGDPGMGKTTLFRGAAKANYRTVRRFLLEPHAIANDILFLDALDEYRKIANGQDASAEVAKALCSLNKPKFRLSCRAADWFGSTDQEVLRVASASGQIVVLELCPLTREEILNAVQGLVQEPVAFLAETESAGLGKLLGNPQTLELLARAWGSDKKPRNKFEAYETGVSELLREINPGHVVRGGTSSDPLHLREATGASATVILLSNSLGVSRAEPADGDGYIRLTNVPYPNRHDLDEALKRRLFFSPDVDRFEPVHRTIAEFLAAEDLSKRIEDGLPINRVMALICGIDGSPVSSLRGLFAWLMCKIGDLAEYYVERDPYGVATYSDAGVLPPGAQCALWRSLAKLRDPWFLSNEDDRGTFRNLANPNTAKIINDVLKDAATSVHLKIAALEAITNSTDDLGLHEIIRDIVLEKHDNIWLRSTALKAYAKSVRNNWTKLKALDDDLAQADDDVAAPQVRVDLVELTSTYGSLPLRTLSIMEQSTSVKQEGHVFGHFYSLIDLPSDADLDILLDGASRGLMPKRGDLHEFRLIFDRWLKRRLDISTAIEPRQLSRWLRNIWGTRHNNQDKEAEASLNARFEKEPLLFEQVFELLANDFSNEEHSFWLFLVDDLWKLLPISVWRVPQYEFFLSRAERESDPQRAADLFRMYMNYFPVEGGSLAVAEAGLSLMESRQDIAEILGNWDRCKIQKWQKEQARRRKQEILKESKNRSQNIAYLAPRLMTIREGKEEKALSWAARLYPRFYSNLKGTSGRERLISVTNDEIADAFIQGFVRYVENPNIPRKKQIIEAWIANSILYTHPLLSLSVCLRFKAGLAIPEEALPDCIAAAVTYFPSDDGITGHNETLSAWLIHEVHQNQHIVESVLGDMWVASATAKRADDLPGFYELSGESSAQQLLASLSSDVLRSGIDIDKSAVAKLVSVLLHQDQRAVITIGETKITRNELSPAIRAIWSTALFIADPGKYLNQWKTLMAQRDAAIWDSIETVRGERHDNRKPLILTSAQRSEIIIAIGQRFANVGHPPNGWSGNQNPWDAAEFVADQIRLLGADGSEDATAQLERLGNNDSLASYHNLIRHHRAQQEKQQRESSFIFAAPEQITYVIQNGPPATPQDLLAFIIDQLNVIASELTRTQRERYRAYWNESGRNLVTPKREEVCSGLMAEDLQNRVRAQNLVVTVEHHMVEDKECDLVVLQGTDRLLPIEVKHHSHRELWTAWRTQLDRLYTRDSRAGGLGIYLVLWSGEAKGRKMPKLPKGIRRPTNAAELKIALESLIPEGDQHRLSVIVVDIARP